MVTFFYDRVRKFMADPRKPQAYKLTYPSYTRHSTGSPCSCLLPRRRQNAKKAQFCSGCDHHNRFNRAACQWLSETLRAQPGVYQLLPEVRMNVGDKQAKFDVVVIVWHKRKRHLRKIFVANFGSDSHVANPPTHDGVDMDEAFNRQVDADNKHAEVAKGLGLPFVVFTYAGKCKDGWVPQVIKDCWKKQLLEQLRLL